MVCIEYGGLLTEWRFLVLGKVDGCKFNSSAW